MASRPLNPEGSNNFWERVTVDERTRMRINGETRAQMEHAKMEKAKNEDTSVDQHWDVDNSLRWRDTYVKVTSALWMLPKMLLLFLPMLLFSLPVLVAVRLYSNTLPTPCDTPDRRSCKYRALCFVAFLLAIPMLSLAFVSLMLDYLMYYVFGIPFCTLTCGWGGYCRSLAVIAPYRGGPWIMLNWSDVVCALMGQEYRHGMVESVVMLANMWLLIPWLKYYVNANPFIYPLEQRMVQQISTSMQDMPMKDIVEAGLQIMSRCKQREDLREVLDRWRFLPHYPYPAPWKRWTVGIQAGGNKIPVMFFLFVHTTHAFAKHCDSTEQFVLSNSIEGPGYRVMLWYNNPYHFFSGWVEASITSGEGSQQPEKNRGGEHPMWLVTTHSPLLSERKSPTGTGWIDNFFDQWLPSIVDGIRGLKNKDKVREYHEEVISKDGRSRPARGQKVPPVDKGDAELAMFEAEKLPFHESAKTKPQE